MRAATLPLGLLGLALAACSAGPSLAEREMTAYQSGYAALQARDYPAAERAYLEAARLAPSDPYVQLDLGVAEQHLGHVEAARQAYRRAAALGSDAEPRQVADPRDAGLSVAQLARRNLATLPR